MPTDLDQLQAIKSQTLAIIADLTAAPKPTYTIDGQQVAWADYLAQLRQTVGWCDDQLARDAPLNRFAMVAPVLVQHVTNLPYSLIEHAHAL